MHTPPPRHCPHVRGKVFHAVPQLARKLPTPKKPAVHALDAKCGAGIGLELYKDHAIGVLRIHGDFGHGPQLLALPCNVLLEFLLKIGVCTESKHTGPQRTRARYVPWVWTAHGTWRTQRVHAVLLMCAWRITPPPPQDTHTWGIPSASSLPNICFNTTMRRPGPAAPSSPSSTQDSIADCSAALICRQETQPPPASYTRSVGGRPAPQKQKQNTGQR
jgi:hypothetical protein